MAAEIPDGAFIVARALFNSSLWTMRKDDKILAITLIGLANWKDRKWWDGKKEIIIKRGQLVRSVRKLAKEAGLSYQEARTSLHHLENVGFLTQESTGTYTILSLPKYDKYQDLTKYSDTEWPQELTQSPTQAQRKLNATSTQAQRTPNDKQESYQGNEGQKGEEAVASAPGASPLGLLIQKGKDQSIAANENTMRTYFGAWVARSSYTKAEQIVSDPWSKGKTVIEIQDHFFPKARGAPDLRSDAQGKTKCLNCGGTGRVADGILPGGGMKFTDCSQCQRKAARA